MIQAGFLTGFWAGALLVILFSAASLLATGRR